MVTKSFLESELEKLSMRLTKAGIQGSEIRTLALDPRLRGGEGELLRFNQTR